jgi:hypothetical protein
MQTRRKGNIFTVVFIFLLISACIGTRSISGIDPTRTALPDDTPVFDSIVVTEDPATPPSVINEPTATSTVVAGSFEDFQSFAMEIAPALQDKNTSFFDEYAAASTWNCLGDETFGVCKDMPADTLLKGVPVTYDWERYELPGKEDYTALWQTTFADHNVVKLVALAHRFGDNPFMPMASQSSLAIIGVGDDPASFHEVRVLFFEYLVNVWHLRGELITTKNAEAWLNNTCDMCYDTWADWTQK